MAQEKEKTFTPDHVLKTLPEYKEWHNGNYFCADGERRQ